MQNSLSASHSKSFMSSETVSKSPPCFLAECNYRRIKHGSLVVFNISPNFTCCVTSRHVTTRQARRVVWVVTWRDVLCRAVSCVLRRACSNMADDEEAVVVACKSISCFIIIYYFSSQMKLIRLLKRITAITTLYTLQTKLRVAPVALVVTRCDVLCRACCTACATQHVRLFPVPKCIS